MSAAKRVRNAPPKCNTYPPGVKAVSVLRKMAKDSPFFLPLGKYFPTIWPNGTDGTSSSFYCAVAASDACRMLVSVGFWKTFHVLLNKITTFWHCVAENDAMCRPPSSFSALETLQGYRPVSLRVLLAATASFLLDTIW